MTAGELLLVVGAVLCALAFAALAVTLLRVRDTLTDLRAETAALLAEMRASVDEAGDAMTAARADLDRFDKVLGSAEAINEAVGRGSRVARTTLSVPMIKAAGLATGTSRAMRRLRKGA
jgi:hypothetical protein